MSEHNVVVQGGSSVRLPTAGKYCDRDIVVQSGQRKMIELMKREGSTVEVPPEVRSLGPYAFYKYSALTRAVVNEGVVQIHVCAFSGCINLTSISLPKSLNCIMGNTFEGCSSLSEVSFPENLTQIYGRAFANCTSLTSVTFKGSKFSTISSDVFTGCTNLLTINVPWAEGAVANAPWGATNATINYNYTGG